MKIISKNINSETNVGNDTLDATLNLQDKNNIIIIRIVLFDDYELYTATILDKKTNEILSSEEYEDLLTAKSSKYGHYFYSLSKEMANSKT